MFNMVKKKTQCNEEPLLSIIIPSYNHENYIAKAIESVMKQTYVNWELIIVDDGSKDNSPNIIRKFKDNRIHLIEQENQGAHNAINRGLGNSNGDYIAILNSDDYFSPDRFKIMVNYLESHNDIGFSCSYIQVVDDRGKKLGIKEGWKNMEPWLPEHPELSLSGTEDFKINLLISNFTSTTSNFLFRRSVMEKIGGMRNLRFVHDWDFALRAAKITECKIFDKPLLSYRIHSTNTISSNRKWMLFEIVWIWAVHLEYFYSQIISKENNNYSGLIKIIESLNVQNCDKIFWIMKIYIDGEIAKGTKCPEEILLENNELRNDLLHYVVE